MMFCKKCGKFLSREAFNKQRGVQSMNCPNCGAVIHREPTTSVFLRRREQRGTVEITTGGPQSSRSMVPIQCPYCGHKKGYTEIIKTGFGDEGDTFVTCCGECHRALRREGGPIGWG